MTPMKKILLVLSLLPMVLAAQMPSVSDTVWVNDEMDPVKREKATRYGIVQEMDTVNHVAIIHYFEPGTERNDVIRRIAFKEKEGKVRFKVLSETLLYPDGAILEELVFTDAKKDDGKDTRTYHRKLFFPDGALKYEETMNEKGEQDCVYYKSNGKIDRHPVEQIPLYQTMPAYPGGLQALIEYLTANVKYPEEARKNGVEGRVLVQFVVDKDGSITKVKVLRSSGVKAFDNEAIRVISSMPYWKPGTVRGKNVRVKYKLPVNFSLK